MRRPDAFFHFDDFAILDDGNCTTMDLNDLVCKRANAILREFFEKAPEVYGRRLKNGNPSYRWVLKKWYSRKDISEGRAQARLVFVEEIGK